MGVNSRPMPEKSPVSFVIIDNNHLTEHGIRYFSALSDKFVLITTNDKHPAFNVSESNLHIILQENLSLKEALHILKTEHGCDRLTIQSGGTLNALFLKEKLFDYIDIVVAPILIGGKNTSSLVDGASLLSPDELSKLCALKLISCEALENSYVRLRYETIK